jgi:dihydroneopterin aldolase
MDDRLSISVDGLRLRGRCGVTAEERALGQTLVVDLRLVPSSCRGALTDRLEDTLDYGGAVDRVREVVEGGEFALLERLATSLADALWSDGLDELSVRVRKLGPPVAVPAESAGAEVVRRR